MNQKITALGGDLHSGNIRCMKCTEAQGGGLDPNYGVLLCANRQDHLEDTLAHGRLTLAASHPIGMLKLSRDGTRLRLPPLQGRLRKPRSTPRRLH